MVTATTANITSGLIRVCVFCEYHWFYHISPKAFYESILVCFLAIIFVKSSKCVCPFLMTIIEEID